MKRNTVLSTIELDKSNRELFKKNNIDVIEHNFIKISKVDFELPSQKGSWIFTSKNSVEAVYSSNQMEKCTKMPHYCVGEKAKSLLLKNGQKIIKMTKNSLELANYIKKKAKNDNFIYCRGSIENKLFSDFFKTNKISLQQVPVYKTKLVPKRIEKAVNAIMFFSPSAIKSYEKNNSIGKSFCFCIGKTTSSVAKEFTKKTYCTNNPSIENVVKQTINFLNNE